MKKVLKTISEKIKKSDTFIDLKTGIKSSDSQDLASMQQGEESSDKVGKGRGDPGRGQGVRGQYTTKQDGGGNSDSSNT